jgi:hypothetical protein
MPKDIKLLFSDYFEVDPKAIENYGAFNISLVSDLPLFIDPFLLFNSGKQEYKQLHQNIIEYLSFLRDKSLAGELDAGLISAWYRFKEVHQTWLGFSISGNKGSGLGKDFASALNKNFEKIFKNYGEEKITHGAHLEKLCLVREGVGKDNISDFTTNLIKEFLLEYTQKFAVENIDKNKLQKIPVDKVVFNYSTESWESKEYILPYQDGDFVLLTPKDILTKDEVWINKDDLYEDFSRIRSSLTNEELRSQLNNFLRKELGLSEKTKKEENEAYRKALVQFPELIDHYVRFKEDNGESAVSISNQKVEISELVYLDHFKKLVGLIRNETDFDNKSNNSFQETLDRAKYIKHIIENCDGYRYFYVDGEPIRKEEDLKILYRMTWYSSSYDVNTEANNGRGPADTVVSKGSSDKTLAEFKLATNTQLKKNLENQSKIYEKAASATHKTVKMIVYFTVKELVRVQGILKELKLENDDAIVLIDARSDNKVSASKAKSY